MSVASKVLSGNFAGEPPKPSHCVPANILKEQHCAVLFLRVSWAEDFSVKKLTFLTEKFRQRNFVGHKFAINCFLGSASWWYYSTFHAIVLPVRTVCNSFKSRTIKFGAGHTFHVYARIHFLLQPIPYVLLS